MSNISRRQFIKTGAAALAGISIAPNTILGKSHGHVSPSDKINILGVGIGGRGAMCTEWFVKSKHYWAL